jgi:hypothetical protein
MSKVQQLAERLLPAAWFAQLKQSSERWIIECTKCNRKRSVWETGGLRWGAASYGKRIAARCSQCGETVSARLVYVDVMTTDTPKTPDCA